MDGREWGCKITGLGCGGLAILAFFGLMMSYSDGAIKSVQARRQRADVAMDLPVLLTAIRQYAGNHEGKLPEMTSPAALKTALFPRYVGDENAFVRFPDQTPYLPNPELSGKTLKSISNPGATIVFSEPAAGFPIKSEARPTHAVIFLNGIFQRQ